MKFICLALMLFCAHIQALTNLYNKNYAMVCPPVRGDNLSNKLTNRSGKSSTIRESNQASGVRKAHFAYYYVRKSSFVLAGTGVRKISSVA